MYIVKNTNINSYVIRDVYRNGVYDTPESTNKKLAKEYESLVVAEATAKRLGSHYIVEKV